MKSVNSKQIPSTIATVNVFDDRVEVIGPLGPVKTALRQGKVEFQSAMKLGLNSARKPLVFYEIDEQGHLISSPGFAPRIIAALKYAGIQTKIRWLCDAESQFSMDRSVLFWASDETRRLADAVEANDRGQIEALRPRDVPPTVAWLVQLFPGLRILVVAGNRVLARKLYARLKPACEWGEIEYAMGGVWVHEHSRIVISGSCSVREPELFQVVILAHALESLDRIGWDHVAELASGPRRIFAIRSENLAQNSWRYMAIEAAAGPQIYPPLESAFGEKSAPDTSVVDVGQPPQRVYEYTPRPKA